MIFRVAIYVLFFLSGLSALIYQILWVRSFSLVFGGSHMAVTTVLSVFMGGLALGGYLGKYVDRSRRPLQVYALLELGIGAAALLLLGMLQIYPDIYVAFARLANHDPVTLTIGRLAFSIIALLLPTTLMGLTLPVLASFSNSDRGNLGKRLAWLYGINTLGAVVGALVAGFFLLRHLHVTTTYALAIGISLLVGIVSIIIDRRFSGVPLQTDLIPGNQQLLPTEAGGENIPVRLILFGIGLSGFCALGYEVLWTRVLSIVVGTTVYGYTLMLVAFLIGIASGGASYRLVLKFFGQPGQKIRRSILWFGFVQLIIGLTTLLVSSALRNLPNQAIMVESWLQRLYGETVLLQTTNFLMALFYMLIPAFFMGLAFPMAGDMVATARGKMGKAVGETLTYNTVGAILGASTSGFLLIYLFGIERSLQYLSLLNLGLGLTVCASLLKSRWAFRGIAPLVAILMVWLYVQPEQLRIWDTKYFAIFNHNARQAFNTEEKRADIFKSSEVLYYAEGTTSTISVVKHKGVSQGINVNGRTVASSSKKDQQCQYTLGHLPMLLHKNPKKVWVLGMGTGMTAGATAIHPEAESVVIVELEKHVPQAARTFSAYNHNLMDHPKVQIVFNDGRNFLLTTEERYDVITADPIHPWSQGAAYLYTDEYYRLAANRLNPGGVMCQWLPIYELTPVDLQSVVKTFANNFKYVYVWLTDYDAELLGSNDPIEINVAALQKRIEASPEVLADLQKVNMGSAADFLSYCIMGPKASLAYGEKAPLNTDNNLYLEFSAPDSKGKSELISINIDSLSSYREDITPYLSGGTLYEKLGTDQASFRRASELYDKAHLLHYQGKDRLSGYARLMDTLQTQFPWHAPSQFLTSEYRTFRARIPRPLDEIKLTLNGNEGIQTVITLAVVSIKISLERVKLLIVDNQAKKIYGSTYVNGKADEIDRLVAGQSKQLLRAIEAVYQQEKADGSLPETLPTLKKIETTINSFQAESI